MTPDAMAPGLAVDEFLDRLIRPARLMVALSGGSDSSGLLHLLHHRLKARAESGINLCVATVDHALRPESADEAEAMARLCATLGLPHTIRRRDGDKPTTGISAAAREARYRLLAEAAHDFSADAILIAHTLEDQQETLLMRGDRSHSDFAPGMAGIAPATLIEGRVWAMRPLLRCRRADIRDYLRSIGQGWIDDPSNDDPRYERVRIRRKIAKEKNEHPSRIEAVSSQVAVPRSTLARAAAELIRENARLHGGTVLQITLPSPKSEEPVLRYCLGGIMAVMGGNTHRPQTDIMDRLLEHLDTEKPFRLSAGRCLIERRRDSIYICREARDLPICDLAPGTTTIWDNRYRVANNTDRRVTIAPGGGKAAEASPYGLPPRLASLGRKSRPHPRLNDTDITGSFEPSVEYAFYFPLFEHFLPVYDLQFANSVVELFGINRFSDPPATHY